MAAPLRETLRRLQESGAGEPVGDSKSAARFAMPYGEVAFRGGILTDLQLTHGTGQNVLSTRGLPLLYVQRGDGWERLPAPVEWHGERQGDTARVTAWGYEAPDGLGYSLTWTVHPLGHIRLELTADTATDAGGLGPLAVVFPFPSRRLDTVFCSSAHPWGIWVLGAADTPRLSFETEETPLGKLVTLYRPGAEAMSIAPHQGHFERLEIVGGETPLVAYTVSAPQRHLQASFYLLPAPVRRRRDLKRAIWAMYNPQDLGGPAPEEAYSPEWEGLYRPGTSPDAIREWAARGYRYFVFHHNWQKWEAGDDAQFGSNRPENEAIMRQLIEIVRQAGMKVIIYMTFMTESNSTDFNQQSAMRYVSEDSLGRDRVIPPKSDYWRLMCLENPYLEHQKDDIDYMIRELGADGIYIDDLGFVTCFRQHGYHSLPTSTIRRIIELITYVKAQGKECFIHAAEMGTIPFLYDIADLSLTGEMERGSIGWEELRPARERHAEPAIAAPGDDAWRGGGLELPPFDRWTRNAGHVGLLSAPWRDDNAEFVAATLAAGFNPLVYMEAGEAVKQVAALLAQFPVEEMSFHTDDELQVTHHQDVRVSAFRGDGTLVLLVIGKEEATTDIKLATDELPPPSEGKSVAQRRYRVMDASAGEPELISALDLAQRGFSVSVKKNEVRVFSIEPEGTG